MLKSQILVVFGAKLTHFEAKSAVFGGIITSLDLPYWHNIRLDSLQTQTGAEFTKLDGCCLR